MSAIEGQVYASWSVFTWLAGVIAGGIGDTLSNLSAFANGLG